MHLINLMPWRVKQAQKRRLWLCVLSGIIWLFVLAGLYCWQHQTPSSSLKTQIQQLQTSVITKQTAIRRMQQQIQQRQQHTKQKQANQYVASILQFLSQRLPANARLTTLIMTPDNITVSGLANSQQVLTDVSKMLLNLPYYHRQKSWSADDDGKHLRFKMVFEHEKIFRRH